MSTNELFSAPDRDGEDLLAAAVTFLTVRPGAAQRALARHAPLADGRCSGCPPTTTRWPCFLAAVALRAESIRSTTNR